MLNKIIVNTIMILVTNIHVLIILLFPYFNSILLFVLITLWLLAFIFFYLDNHSRDDEEKSFWNNMFKNIGPLASIHYFERFYLISNIASKNNRFFINTYKTIWIWIIVFLLVTNIVKLLPAEYSSNLYLPLTKITLLLILLFIWMIYELIIYLNLNKNNKKSFFPKGSYFPFSLFGIIKFYNITLKEKITIKNFIIKNNRKSVDLKKMKLIFDEFVFIAGFLGAMAYYVLLKYRLENLKYYIFFFWITLFVANLILNLKGKRFFGNISLVILHIIFCFIVNYNY